jgi:hypothetical protein
MRLLKIAAGLFVFAFACVAPALAHAQIVTNGNFFDGSAGWTSNPSSSYPWTFDGAGTSNSYASTGCVGEQCITGTMAEQAYLFQDLTTVTGDTYTLSFEFAGDGDPMELQAWFGGTLAEDLLNIPDTTLTEYVVTDLVATSTTTELEFLGRQDPGFDELTDVSVTDNSTVTPEPGTLGLLGTGVLGLIGVARRKLSV